MDKVVFGKVVKLHGYLGLVKINAKFDSDFELKKIEKMFDENGNEFTVIRISKTKDGVIVGFENVDLERAKTFIGRNFFIERKIVSNKILIQDLKGSDVFFEDGELVGKIIDIQDYGTAEVFEIKSQSGKNIMFPNVKDLILDFDYKEKKLVVNKKRFGEVSDENWYSYSFSK